MKGQAEAEFLDLRIQKNILKIKIRCCPCRIEYKGILLEYRKVKENEDESYLIPYETLDQQKDWLIMAISVDLKQYYLRMLYWDIRCAFLQDGKLCTVTCHFSHGNQINKYKKIWIDRAYPTENSILFPCIAGNQSIALMHRQICPQDHLRFRLKEKAALVIYKLFHNHWDKKNLYLIFEKHCAMAQDNGYYFFRYCMEQIAEQDFDKNIYYVLTSDSPDWNSIQPYKNKVLKYLSLKHMIYLLAAKVLISTETKGHAYVWRSMGSKIQSASYQKKLIFLQHGVTGFKKGNFHKGTSVGCDCFITTSSGEQDIVREHLGYRPQEAPITGFARWDVLEDQSEGHREILLMPTWRPWLDDVEHQVFARNEYCIKYQELLNHPKFNRMLQDHGVKLIFYLHPRLRNYLSEFRVNTNSVRLITFGEIPLNQLMMECNLLITDYSSIAWDIYYMNKPVIFYQFDLYEMEKNPGFYIDMKESLFGDRTETLEELLHLVDCSIQHDFRIKEKYAKMQKQYFTYMDKKNSERIWKEICHIR